MECVEYVECEDSGEFWECLKYGKCVECGEFGECEKCGECWGVESDGSLGIAY